MTFAEQVFAESRNPFPRALRFPIAYAFRLTARFIGRVVAVAVVNAAIERNRRP